MSLTDSIQQNFQVVRNRIQAACERTGRDAREVQLLAVSKTFSADAVRAASLCGQHAFGENYVQEGINKVVSLNTITPQLEWHFIGPLQSNKTADVAQHFDWVHGIDRLKIAQRLSDQRPAELPPLQVCIQVNISAEDSKSGVAPQDVLPLARSIAALPRLKLRGLMALPAPAANESAQRVPFRHLRELLLTLKHDGLAVDALSMGMSADLEAAIAEGATIVRVGTALFGAR
jgi:PLP dependent protein